VSLTSSFAAGIRAWEANISAGPTPPGVLLSCAALTGPPSWREARRSHRCEANSLEVGYFTACSTFEHGAICWPLAASSAILAL
jgi:hypothetical protein